MENGEGKDRKIVKGRRETFFCLCIFLFSGELTKSQSQNKL